MGKIKYRGIEFTITRVKGGPIIIDGKPAKIISRAGKQTTTKKLYEYLEKAIQRSWEMKEKILLSVYPKPLHESRWIRVAEAELRKIDESASVFWFSLFQQDPEVREAMEKHPAIVREVVHQVYRRMRALGTEATYERGKTLLLELLADKIV